MLYLKLLGFVAVAVGFPWSWFNSCGYNGRFCHEDCDHLERTLEQNIVGQELAVQRVSTLVCEHVRQRVSGPSPEFGARIIDCAAQAFCRPAYREICLQSQFSSVSRFLVPAHLQRGEKQCRSAERIRNQLCVSSEFAGLVLA